MTPVFKPFTIIVSSFALQNMPALEANQYCSFLLHQCLDFVFSKLYFYVFAVREVYCEVLQREHSFQNNVTFSLMF